jgi:hypothetical protein
MGMFWVRLATVKDHSDSGKSLSKSGATAIRDRRGGATILTGRPLRIGDLEEDLSRRRPREPVAWGVARDADDAGVLENGRQVGNEGPYKVEFNG